MNKILLHTILPFFTFLLIGNISFAQAPAIEWQTRVMDGSGSDVPTIQSTTDGGYIVIGTTQTSIDNHGMTDFYVIKMNSTGAITWQKSYGGSSSDAAYFITQTTDGGYIATGRSRSNDGDATINHGAFDYWVIKIDSVGNLQWQKSYGGSGSDSAQDIKQTSDGGYIVTGYTTSNNGDVSGQHLFNPTAIGFDYWVIKIDGTGNLQWQKCLGGTGFEASYSIEQTTDGGYILVGQGQSIDGDVTGNHGETDYWVVKLNTDGVIEWQKSLGGPGRDWGMCIKQTTDGGYIVTGQISQGGGDITDYQEGNNSWVVKLNPDGNIQWQKSLNGIGGMAIALTADGGYILCSYISDANGPDGYYNYLVLKINGEGNLIWQKTLGGSSDDRAFSIAQSADGGYVVAGMSFSTDGDVIGSPENGYVWIVKIAADTAGLNAPTKNSLTLYPNPGNGTFTLNTEKLFTGTATLNVYSAFGQLLYSKQITEATTTTISLPEFATGIYNVQLLANNKSYNQKLIIE